VFKPIFLNLSHNLKLFNSSIYVETETLIWYGSSNDYVQSCLGASRYANLTSQWYAMHTFFSSAPSIIPQEAPACRHLLNT